jgi:hypothetical protein
MEQKTKLPVLFFKSLLSSLKKFLDNEKKKKKYIYIYIYIPFGHKEE